MGEPSRTIRWKEQLIFRPELRDVSRWPRPDVSHLPPEDVSVYKLRQAAVQQVLNGDSVSSAATTLTRSQGEMYRLLARALESEADGDPALNVGLIPDARIGVYERTVTSAGQTNGLSGAFSQLLRRDCVKSVFDALRKAIKARLQRKTDAALLRHRAVHQTWLKELELAGIKATEYPFTATPGKGSDSLRRWCKRETDQILADRKSVKEYENALASDAVLEVMDCFQFDERRQDVQVTIAFKVRDEVIKVRAARLWVLAIVERRSTAIFGLTWGLGDQPRQDDVLECLADAVTPWTPLKELPAGLEYPPDSGAPSIIPELQWAIPYFFELDNAMSHFGSAVRAYLHKAWRCVINWGRPAFPAARHIVEMVMARLASIEHQFPSTTGNNPFDPRRDPRQHEPPVVFIQDIPAFLDVVRATINATPRDDLFNRSPLQVLRDACKSGILIRHLPAEYRDTAAPHRVRRKLTITGDLGLDVDLHVNFVYDRYTGRVLRDLWGRGERSLLVEYDRRDIRFLDVIGENGETLGQIKKQGPWAGFPHDERMRREARKVTREQRLNEDKDMREFFTGLTKTPERPREALKVFDVFQRLLNGEGIERTKTPDDATTDESPPPSTRTVKWAPRIHRPN